MNHIGLTRNEFILLLDSLNFMKIHFEQLFILGIDTESSNEINAKVDYLYGKLYEALKCID